MSYRKGPDALCPHPEVIMPPATGLLWDLEPHTAAKHRVYGAYLDALHELLG